MEDSSKNKFGRSENEMNLGIGFNDIDFSDRVLRLEVTPLASNKNFGGEKYLNCFSSIHANDSESGCGFEVKTFNICSLVLASKSPFFYKLFKNGMKKSQKKGDFILRVNESEEAAFMDLLNFMYDKPLTATSRADLVDVLMAADKFEVTCCVRYCVDMLLKLPMSTESALLYLELPPSVFEGEIAHPLIDAAKQYFAAHYSDFTKSQQEAAMALPLCAIEAVLGSDDLQLCSEDVVLDFILKWARQHYPKLEERREILTNRLVGFICFPCMSCLKLKEAVDCPDFDYEKVSKLVLNALFSKVELPHGHNSIPSPANKTLFSNDVLASCGFPRRVYPHRRLVYFNIKKQDCAALYPSSKRFYSEAFFLGGRYFSLFAQYREKKENSAEHFGLFVEMTDSESCTLHFEFAVMKRPSKEFQTQGTANKCTLTATEKAKGTWLFEWTDLMRDKSVYFIDEILHLRAQLSMEN